MVLITCQKLNIPLSGIVECEKYESGYYSCRFKQQGETALSHSSELNNYFEIRLKQESKGLGSDKIYNITSKPDLVLKYDYHKRYWAVLRCVKDY
jgi:hypothetical protein